ncbi:type 1 glutamine amidotransferase [Paenibacillus tuaregi]|uniref:type 1 glutamine amidotransferase n=1 Tax=Paenibacillus tuaregi TaxID=1816681 RepID=UPI0008386E28|nr:type 1 glutamine amidotransferase [Paenibacillus tuaregi]
MRIHYLQHVPFESLGNIAKWAEERGHSVTGTHLYNDILFPEYSDFDLLIVLGGPMGVNDESEYSWLVDEKRFISGAVHSRKHVLGICLGAQLIAEVIGGKVELNAYKEIGWHPVRLTEMARLSDYFRSFPEEFIPFHWHGETFQLPEQAVHMAYSRACANQAYVYEDHVVGLQFHLEFSEDSVHQIMKYCSHELVEDLYIQQPHQLTGKNKLLNRSVILLYSLLDAMQHDWEYRSYQHHTETG